MNELHAILLTIFATFIGAFGSLYLKKGSRNLHRNPLTLLKNHELQFGIFLFLFSSVFYIIALKFVDLSLIYPVTSLGYVWISFLSIKFLNEEMNKYKWIGIFLIILGVVFIAR